MDLSRTTTRFKKARWLGSVPEESLPIEGSDAEIAYWQQYRLDKVHGQSGPVSGLCYSPSGPQNLLVAASLRVTIRDGEASDSEKKLCLVDGGSTCVSYRSDGRLAAVGSVSGKVLVIEVATRSVLREFGGHEAAVRSAKFLSDKLHLLSVGDDNAVCLWEISSGSLVWRKKENDDFVRALAVPGDSSELFAIGSYDHSVLLWRLCEAAPYGRLDHGSPVESVAFLPGSRLASAGHRSIRIWSVSDGALLQEIFMHHKAISSIAVSPDGKYLLSASIDHSLKVLRLSDFLLVRRLKLPSAILSLAISNDSRRISLGTSSGHVYIVCPRNSDARIGKRSLESGAAKAPIIASADIIDIGGGRTEPLQQFDRLLKSFRYRQAFDVVLARRNPRLLVTAVRELMRREGMVVALSGRSEGEVALVVETIRRFLSKPRLSSFLIEIAFQLLDIYASTLGGSPYLLQVFQKLHEALIKQIRISQRLIELEGQVELIRSSNRLNSLS